MPSANVDAIRAAYAAYDRRDVAALQDLSQDDCVVHTLVEGQAEPRPFEGRDGIREWIENENEVWSSVRIEELELRDIGGDRVFTDAVARVRGRASGVELRIPVYTVIALRDGRMTSLHSYPSRAEALAAAGLDAS